MMRLIFTAVTKSKVSSAVRYLIIFVSAWFFFGCTHLMYPADRNPFVIQEKLQPVPEDIYIPVQSESHEGRESTEGQFLHAWHFSAKTKSKGLVVHFHGNGQNLTAHFLFLSWLTEHGYDYLIFDYRGYGASSDADATPEKTVQDGETVFRYVHEKYPQLAVVAVGQSLGSNVLVRTLQELNEKKQFNYLPKLVVLESSFLSYQQAARSVLSQRWFLTLLKPFTYFAISDTWSAEKKLQFTPHVPALFFHGTEDKIVNFELGQKNFDLWPGPKTFVPQTGGGHTAAFLNPRFMESRRVLLQNMDQVLQH